MTGWKEEYSEHGRLMVYTSKSMNHCAVAASIARTLGLMVFTQSSNGKFQVKIEAKRFRLFEAYLSGICSSV